MTWQNNTNENKITALVKRETEKAFLIIAKDIADNKGFREFWVPKSQIFSAKPCDKCPDCEILGLSDWIFEKLVPASPMEFEGYEGTVKMPKVNVKSNARNYVIKPRPTKVEEEDGYLVPEESEIPF